MTLDCAVYEMWDSMWKVVLNLWMDLNVCIEWFMELCMD